MDSRTYIFIYPLKTNADVPADFSQDVRTAPFETGVFLPQDDSNWFTRPPQYPARLLLLEGRSLRIVSHPASQRPLTEIKLDELLQLETGHVLLLGWMKFTTSGGVHELAYNTRASRPLETFLIALKRRWLGSSPPTHNVRSLICGGGLDIKFRNLLDFELDRDETALIQYFEAPVAVERKLLFFRRKKWRPGNLVLLTSMNRLVWITDQYKQRRESYGAISFSTPSPLLRSCRIEGEEGQQDLVISFIAGATWRIGIYEHPEESSSFCRALNRTCQATAAPATQDPMG